MKNPNISIFFPAFNEEENIKKLIESSIHILKESTNKSEIIIVLSDKSTDNTGGIIKQMQKKNPKANIRLIYQHGRGIGDAYRIGLVNAKMDYIFYSDSDNQFNLKQIKFLLGFLPEYDLVTGYRKHRKDPVPRIIISEVYNLLIRMMFNIKEKDLDCAFKIMKKQVVDKIQFKSKSGMFSPELLIKTKRLGYKIKQIEVDHYPRTFGNPKEEMTGLPIHPPKVVFTALKELYYLYRDVRKMKK